MDGGEPRGVTLVLGALTVPCFVFRVPDFRVPGSGFRVFGFRVPDLGVRG